MAVKYREKWTRDETILALDLYCRTPFSKIAKENKAIQELAKLLGRTPSAVALKMSNLAHHDPEMKARNLTGMSNGSKLDKEVFLEFTNNWGELSYQAQQIKSKISKIEFVDLWKDNFGNDDSHYKTVTYIRGENPDKLSFINKSFKNES